MCSFPKRRKVIPERKEEWTIASVTIGLFWLWFLGFSFSKIKAKPFRADIWVKVNNRSSKKVCDFLMQTHSLNTYEGSKVKEALMGMYIFECRAQRKEKRSIRQAIP